MDYEKRLFKSMRVLPSLVFLTVIITAFESIFNLLSMTLENIVWIVPSIALATMIGFELVTEKGFLIIIYDRLARSIDGIRVLHFTGIEKKLILPYVLLPFLAGLSFRMGWIIPYRLFSILPFPVYVIELIIISHLFG